MKILVVNDDGINSEGIRMLVEKCKKYGAVYVVAPHTEQSGAGHAITIHEPMKLYVRDDFMEGVKAWSLEGKPADCVKFALFGLNLDIDVVVSGINRGPNLGTDVNYSGTIAGASEGVILGLPAIAVSSDSDSFVMAERNLECVLDKILDGEVLDKKIVINVNFPSRKFEDAKGIMITEQGFREFLHEFELDGEQYWARGKWGEVESAKGTDTYAFENGYISITPIKINRTDYEYMNKLKKIFD